MVVIVWGYGQSGSGEVEAASLYAGEGIREDPYPSVFLKCGEGRVYRYEFCSHDGVGFLASGCVDENGGARRYVYHGCP